MDHWLLTQSRSSFHSGRTLMWTVAGYPRISATLIFRIRTTHFADRILGPRQNMGIRLPSISLTKYTILVASQLVVNLSLGLWLYNEYLHNPFMQVYISNAWSSIWPGVAVAVGVAAGSGAVFAAYGRRVLPMFVKEPARIGAIQSVGTSASLSTLDVCPFCELPLKTISEGRLQCRSCRRYFKSSLPKEIAV